MSWDITIQNFPDVRRVEDIPDDYRPGSLGSRADLIARIREVAPEVDFSSPAWGVLDGDGFSIEFNMGDGEICNGFMLHVRGGGAAVVALIARLIEHLRLRGIDCQSGEFFSLEEAERSFAQWQKYRDKVVESGDIHGQSVREPNEKGSFDVGICEICKGEPATVHITAIVNGKAVDENLCAACAEPRLSQTRAVRSAGWTSYDPPGKGGG